MVWLAVCPILPTAAQNQQSAQNDLARAMQAKATPAQIVSRIEPEYTPEARAAGLQGVVVLFMTISPSGQLTNVGVIQGLGLGLDEKAVAAVRQWRFTAGTRDGVPDWSAQCVEIEFRLNAANSWFIRRAGFRINQSRKRAGPVSRPILQHYGAPAADACRSDGAAVIANLSISKKGKVEDAKLAEQHGDANGDAVLNAIRAWDFQPGKLSDKASESTGRFEMECHTSAGGASTPDEDATTYRLGQGISPPLLRYKVEPQYAEEARKAKFQGTAILSMDVDASGYARKVWVLRRLGMGLDEKAAEAVYQWRFKPAEKDGTPIRIVCTVEVNFRLL
jgi:TonB family protein